MSKSSELMRSVLAAAQRYDSPDAAVQGRVWAAVEQRVDAGDPGPAIADSTGNAIGSGSAGWLTPLRVLMVLGGIGLAVGAVALGREQPEPAPAVEPVQSPPVAALTESDVVVPDAPAAAPVPPAPARAAELPEPTEARARKPLARAELDATDSLGLEVELLRRARTAANAGRPREALAVLQEHLRRFPRGKLARERDMSRLRAYCALGKQADAKKLAGSMLGRDGSDVLRAKLQKTCAGSIE
jgi:hypothetical protein